MRKGNSSSFQGTFWAVVIGFIVGIVRMIINFSFKAPVCGEPDTRPSILRNVHYLYFALVLFLLTGILYIVISLLTEPPEGELVSLRFQSLKLQKQSFTNVLQNICS